MSKDAKIKVSEIFYSLQGEGAYVGVPSIFLRTFGCNFTCGGFGMPRGEKSTERDSVDPTGLSYKQLPLVSTGCDSYASWDPRFKHLSPVLTAGAIVDEFEKLLPGGKFGPDKHLIITGGEPLLGWQSQYPALLAEIEGRDMQLTNLTFETNGTQMLKPALLNELAHYAAYDLEVTFSISAKLPCSGEKWEDAIKPDVVASYLKVPYTKSYFKFVVADQQDIEDAIRAVKQYAEAGIHLPTYLMPVGGTVATYVLTERQVADFCRDNGVRFSPRLQVGLYKNAWGT